MKKKIIGLIMVVMVVVLFSTGCNGSGNATQVPDSEPIISSVDDPQPVVIEDSEVVSEIESEPEEVSEVEPEEDPMEMFKVDAGWASQRREIGCIVRGGDVYAVDYANAGVDKYNVGCADLSGDERSIYCITFLPEERLFTVGDFEIPILNGGDRFVIYSSYGVKDQYFGKAVFHGYCLPICESQSQYLVYNPGVDWEVLNKGSLSDFCVVDENDNVIADRFNLENGKEYTVRWYYGTQYNEIKMTANCKSYELPSEDSYIAIQGTLTKNGYAEYDLSGFEPGVYYHRDGGLIEIQ